MITRILLQFLNDDVWRATQTTACINELTPTEMWVKFGQQNDKTMWLQNNINETPEGTFERCLTIIHRHIIKNTDPNLNNKIKINWDKSTLKNGTILFDNEVLVKVLSLEPDFV